jgi:2'-5' RNA ligase
LTRAFVAIRPPDSVLDAVEVFVAQLDLREAKRTTREQWHITVQFLGNHADIDAVVVALERLHTPPSSIQLVGGGGVRTVVSLGAEPLEWLRELASEVEARLAPLGHEPEHRPYRPHLTLARGRRLPRLGNEPVGEAWVVESVVVFESQTKPSGAVHIARAEIPLGNA